MFLLFKTSVSFCDQVILAISYHRLQTKYILDPNCFQCKIPSSTMHKSLIDKYEKMFVKTL